MFRTDIKQVFDFIRCSGDPVQLKNLVENDPAYQAMEEDAYDVAAQYTRTEELMRKKEYGKGRKINMCNAIAELIREGKDAGYHDGYSEGKNVGYSEGKDVGYAEGINAEREANIQILVRTCLDFNIPREQIRERIMSQYGLTALEAERYINESGR